MHNGSLGRHAPPDRALIRRMPETKRPPSAATSPSPPPVIDWHVLSIDLRPFFVIFFAPLTRRRWLRRSPQSLVKCENNPRGVRSRGFDSALIQRSSRRPCCHSFVSPLHPGSLLDNKAAELVQRQLLQGCSIILFSSGFYFWGGGGSATQQLKRSNLACVQAQRPSTRWPSSPAHGSRALQSSLWAQRSLIHSYVPIPQLLVRLYKCYPQFWFPSSIESFSSPKWKKIKGKNRKPAAVWSLTRSFMLVSTTTGLQGLKSLITCNEIIHQIHRGAVQF